MCMFGFYNVAKVFESSICLTSLPDVCLFKIYLHQNSFHVFKEYTITFIMVYYYTIILLYHNSIIFSQIDYSVFTQQPLEEEVDSKSFDEMEQSLLILSESKASLMSTRSLWKQQVYTIAKFHFLTLKRESKSVRSV